MIRNLLKEIFFVIKYNRLYLTMVLLIGLVGYVFLQDISLSGHGKAEIKRNSGLLMVKKLGDRNFNPIMDRAGLLDGDMVFLDNEGKAVLRLNEKSEEINGIAVFTIRKNGSSLSLSRIFNNSRENEIIEKIESRDADNEKRIIIKKNIYLKKIRQTIRYSGLKFINKEENVLDDIDIYSLRINNICESCIVESLNQNKYLINKTNVVVVPVVLGRNRFTLASADGVVLDSIELFRYRKPPGPLFPKDKVYIDEEKILEIRDEDLELIGCEDLINPKSFLIKTGSTRSCELKIKRRHYYPDVVERYELIKRLPVVKWVSQGGVLKIDKNSTRLDLERKENGQDYFIRYYLNDRIQKKLKREVFDISTENVGKHCFVAVPLGDQEQWKNDNGVCFVVERNIPDIKKYRKLMMSYNKQDKKFHVNIENDKCENGKYALYGYDDVYLKNKLKDESFLGKKITIGSMNDYRYIMEIKCGDYGETFRLFYPVAPFGVLNE